MTTRGNIRRRGFTVLELMIVVVIIGLIAGLTVPRYVRYKQNAQVAATAAEIKLLSTAFVAYKAAFGDFPPDSHLTLPAGMENFIDPQIWADETPIGGHYNWEGPDFYPYAGLAVAGSAAPQWQINLLDTTLDDGNLNTGSFIVAGNGRPTFIIEQ